MPDQTKTPSQTDSKPASPEFHPAPGYVLAKPLTRDEVSNMSTSLSLPEMAGKEKDAVGVARVLELGDFTPVEQWQTHRANQVTVGPKGHFFDSLAVGDLIAYMPFTDVILLHGYEKRSLVPFSKIVAVAKATTEVEA